MVSIELGIQQVPDKFFTNLWLSVVIYLSLCLSYPIKLKAFGEMKMCDSLYSHNAQHIAERQ